MKTTLISSLLTTSMLVTPVTNTVDDAKEISEPSTVLPSNKSIVELPITMEYIQNLYNEIDPCKALLKYIHEQEQREEFAKKREKELEERALKEAEEAKLELARRESVTFDPYDVTQLSYVTEQELRQVLSLVNGGDGLMPYSSYFVEAEKTYGINAFFITAIAAQESGWGQKAAGNGTNLTGYAVYTRHHSGKTFKGGVRENILATTKLIAEEYVNPKGRYYTKWNNYSGKSIFEINQKYCLLQDQKTVDNRWSKALNKIGANLNKTYHETVKKRTI